MQNGRLQTEIQQTETHPILAVTGEIDIYTAPQFSQAVVRLISDGTLHVVVDMSGVTYMDSSGFSSLLSATKQLRPGGGALHLVGARPTVQRMLHLTRLDTVIFLHPNMQEALEATQDPSTAKPN